MKKLRFPSISRVCTEEKLKKIFKKLNKGNVLYVGVETNTYKSLIPHTTFKTLDIQEKYKPDIVGDIHNIKIEDEQFDTVIAIQLLEHFQYPRKAIQELYRVLNPDGVMIISVPFLYQYHKSPKDYYRFTTDSLEDLTKDFKNVKIKSTGNKFLTLWQIISGGNLMKKTHFKKLCHLFNPILKHFDFIKKTDFAFGYIVLAKK